LTDSAVVLHPTEVPQNKSFWRHFPQANLLAWYGKKLNLTQQKHAFTNQKMYYKCTTQNKHKKLKPGLVAFYDIWPRAVQQVYSQRKKQVREEIHKKVKKKLNTEIKNRIKGALRPEPTRGLYMPSTHTVAAAWLRLVHDT